MFLDETLKRIFIPQWGLSFFLVQLLNHKIPQCFLARHQPGKGSRLLSLESSPGTRRQQRKRQSGRGTSSTACTKPSQPDRTGPPQGAGGLPGHRRHTAARPGAASGFAHPGGRGRGDIGSQEKSQAGPGQVAGLLRPPRRRELPKGRQTTAPRRQKPSSYEKGREAQAFPLRDHPKLHRGPIGMGPLEWALSSFAGATGSPWPATDGTQPRIGFQGNAADRRRRSFVHF